MTKQTPALMLSNKVCLITGAARGLGRHFAKTLARSGATIIATSLQSELPELNSLVNEIIESGGDALSLDIDIRDIDSFETKISSIIDEVNHIDVLINNAGISYYTKFFDIQESDWTAHMDVNLKGAFFLSKTIAKHMLEQHISGSIINIGSIAGSQSKKYALPFCVSKAGMHHLTKVMAFELAEHNIRVNTIAPGLFPTPDVKKYIDTPAGKNFIQQIPLNRPGKYEELDGALLLLASDQSAYMSGSLIEVDGGFAMDLFLREDFEDGKTNAFFVS